MIVGISGLARVGKDTLGRMLARELNKKMGDVYILMSYAHELKNRVQMDFDLSYDQLWGDSKEVEDKRYVKKDGGYWTAREILQFFGTDCFRAVDNDFWVKKLFNVIEDKEYENVIITDIRFPNEVDAVIEKDGLHIRILRNNCSEIHGSTHESETILSDDYKVDFLVENFGTLDDLVNTAKNIVGSLVALNKIK